MYQSYTIPYLICVVPSYIELHFSVHHALRAEYYPHV